jgi:hypothetical protein
VYITINFVLKTSVYHFVDLRWCSLRIILTHIEFTWTEMCSVLEIEGRHCSLKSIQIFFIVVDKYQGTDSTVQNPGLHINVA